MARRQASRHGRQIQTNSRALGTAVVALVTGLLAFLVGFSTLVIVLAALVGGVLHYALRSMMDHNRADTAIAAALLLGTAAAAYGYNKYELIPAGIELKLSALDPDQTMIAGVSIQPVLRNENNFDVWWRLDRRQSSVKTPKSSNSLRKSDQDVRTGKVLARTAASIPGDPIVFEEPLYTTRLAGGSIVYHLCYGRSKEALAKGLHVTATFEPVFDGTRVSARLKSQQTTDEPCDKRRL